ncbi:MAG: hypothetical protein KJO31_09290 [Gammaproteobacteria bacterium]|nr:hypothetical protein [Gammaproteobacteria bacterium]
MDALTKSLRLVVNDSSKSVAASGGTQNPEAYDAYLRGHYLIQSTNASRISEGLDELRRAIEIDPSFGLPYADIADALSQSIFYGLVDDRELFGEARNAARSAVALAKESPEAHVAAATMHQYVTFDWRAAEASYETALSLQPQSPAPYHRYADFLWTTLRLERAKEVAQMALAADPLDGSAMHAVGITQLIAGEFARAADAFGEWNRFHPDSRWSYVKYSLALALNGQCDAALERADKVLELLGRAPSLLAESWLAWGYHVCDRTDRYAASRKRFESLIESNPASLEPGLAYYFLLEGDNERLFALVRRLIDAESPLTMFLPIFTLGGMGWSDDNLAQRQAVLNELLRELNFPPGDFT